MDSLNKKYGIKIEALTPLSIGAGIEKDWSRGVDFVVNRGKAYILSIKKISELGIDLSRLTAAFASKDEKVIISLITDKHLDAVSDDIFVFPADSPNDIKSFVKNQLNGKPLLTGSSLKGAVRSILFEFLRKNERDDKEVFGNSKVGDEFMRYMKFSDVEFENTDLVNTKIFNLQNKGGWHGGWKHGGRDTSYNFKDTGFNTIYECIMPGIYGYASLMFSLKAFELYKRKGEHKYEKEKRQILGSDIKALFKIVNQHTKEYLLKEKAFFEKYSQADNTHKIIDSINNLLDQIPSDNTCCVLKMSAGAGFHSITGDWQFNDYTIDSVSTRHNGSTDKSYGYNTEGEKSKSAKSRKIAVWNDHFDMMGFVKMSLLSEETSKSVQDEKRRMLADREKRHKMILEKERLERIEIEKKKQENQKLLDEYEKNSIRAIDAFENEKWDDVLYYVDSASLIFPHKAVELTEYLEKAKSNIAIIESQRAIALAKQREEDERRMSYSVPLIEKIGVVNKLPTLFGNLKQWMKQNGVSSLSEGDNKVLRERIVEVYNSLNAKEKATWKNKPSQWKELKLLMGDDFVNDLVEILR